MLTIKRVLNKFTIKFSDPGSGARGYTVTAKDVPEIITFIEHHYGSQRHKIGTCKWCNEARKA